MNMGSCNECGRKKKVCKKVSDCFKELRIYIGTVGKPVSVSVIRNNIRAYQISKVSDALGFVTVLRSDLPVGYISTNQNVPYQIEIDDEHGAVCMPVCCDMKARTLVFSVVIGSDETITLNPPCKSKFRRFCERKYKVKRVFCERKYKIHKPCRNRFCERKYKFNIDPNVANMFKGLEVNCNGTWVSYLMPIPADPSNIAVINAWLVDMNTKHPASVPLLVWSYDSDLDLYAIRHQTPIDCEVREILGNATLESSVCRDYPADTFPKTGCTNPVASNYDATADFDDGSCLYFPAPPPNPSGVMAGTIRVVSGQNGDLADGFEPDPNICSPSFLYAIISESITQTITKQILSNNPAAIDLWIRNNALALPNIDPQIYYCAVYGECNPNGNAAPTNPTLPNGSDWNTIQNTWTQLHAIKFQGGGI